MRTPDIFLQGSKVTIRPITLHDLDEMSTWPASSDPLDQFFDWPARSARENRYWFVQLEQDPARVYYAVANKKGELIGRISLRNMRKGKSTRLGIGFGPQFVGQGYGTDALQTFLAYYFSELGFNEMELDVAAINVRAVRCYERCGFQYTGSHYDWVDPDQVAALLRCREHQHLKRFFKRTRYRSELLFYDMVLDKARWEALRNQDLVHSANT